MKRPLQWIIVLCLLTTTGCYHTRVETGLTPSSQVIDIPWAASWIAGLVPPKTVEASSECSTGVAVVETEHTFLNQVVAGITFGIFTPMHIKVTCATGGGMGMNEGEGRELRVSADASSDEIVDTFAKAANEAVQNRDRIYVRFE